MNQVVAASTAETQLANEVMRRVDTLSRREPGLPLMHGVRCWAVLAVSIGTVITISLALL